MPSPSSDPSISFSPLSPSKIADRTHSLLSFIIHLVPSTSASLLPVLMSSFPHQSESIEKLLWWSKNALKICEYCPGIQNEIVTALTGLCLDMDVSFYSSLFIFFLFSPFF